GRRRSGLSWPGVPGLTAFLASAPRVRAQCQAPPEAAPAPGGRKRPTAPADLDEIDHCLASGPARSAWARLVRSLPSRRVVADHGETHARYREEEGRPSRTEQGGGFAGRPEDARRDAGRQGHRAPRAALAVPELRPERPSPSQGHAH